MRTWGHGDYKKEGAEGASRARDGWFPDQGTTQGGTGTAQGESCEYLLNYLHFSTCNLPPSNQITIDLCSSLNITD